MATLKTSTTLVDVIAGLVNNGHPAGILTLQLGDDFECDVEILIHRTKNLNSGQESILSAPVGNYDPPGAFPAPARVQ